MAMMALVEKNEKVSILSKPFCFWEKLEFKKKVKNWLLSKIYKF